MLNPLLAKEFRTQMRGWEICAVAVIYLLALSALTFSLFWESSASPRLTNPEHGKEMFFAFAIVLILAVCLIGPAFTVGAISSEREKMTFDQLRVTLLKPHQILIGKAGPPLVYILILLFASLPAAILVFSSGGVTAMDVASCYLIALISAGAFSLVGLMCSSVYKSTRASTAMAYSITGLFTFGTAVLPMILSGVFQLRINRILFELCLSLNPFHAVISMLGRGTPVHSLGMPPWIVAIIGYLIVSIFSAFISLLNFRRMRS